MARLAKSLDREGQIAVKVPIWIPIEEMFAKPQRANDIICIVRGLNVDANKVL
jgi:hypothetical protein